MRVQLYCTLKGDCKRTQNGKKSAFTETTPFLVLSVHYMLPHVPAVKQLF